MATKRADYISWEEYFMGIAKLSAQRSKDPSTQVGACIVGDDNKILGIGYNGFPRGCSDDKFSWERPEKYMYVVHAEVNGILNVNNYALVKGSKLYTTLFPCNECAKVIIQTGVSEIIYMDDKYEGTETDIAAKKMFDAAGVKYHKYNIEPKYCQQSDDEFMAEIGYQKLPDNFITLLNSLYSEIDWSDTWQSVDGQLIDRDYHLLQDVCSAYKSSDITGFTNLVLKADSEEKLNSTITSILLKIKQHIGH